MRCSSPSRSASGSCPIRRHHLGRRQQRHRRLVHLRIVTIVGTKLAGHGRPPPPLRLRSRGNTSPVSSSPSLSLVAGFHLPARVHRQDHPRHPQLLGHYYHRHRGGHPREDRHRHHVQSASATKRTPRPSSPRASIPTLYLQCCRPARWWWRRPKNFWNLNIGGAVGPHHLARGAESRLRGARRRALSPAHRRPRGQAFVDDITAYANSFPDVRGTYDVVLDNFGPNLKF